MFVRPKDAQEDLRHSARCCCSLAFEMRDEFRVETDRDEIKDLEFAFGLQVISARFLRNIAAEAK
jgi:hypothetical protein